MSEPSDSKCADVGCEFKCSSRDSSNRKRNPEGINESNIQDFAKRVKLEDVGIRENDVGITKFVSPEIPGFYGQIKQRYTDFLVNEINLDGEVIRLTDKGFKLRTKSSDVRDKENMESSNKYEEIANDNTFVTVEMPETSSKANTKKDVTDMADFEVDPALRQKLVHFFGEDDVTKIEDVYRTAQRMETQRTFKDKAQRTEIHGLLREAFNDKLESVTTAECTFKIARNNRKSRMNSRVRLEQSKDSNDVVNWGYGPSKRFIHFTLHKENKDTMEAASIICRLLRAPPKIIRYAGTKDRRAVTVQRLSIYGIKLDRLNALNKALRGMTIGSYKFEDDQMSLGQLSGNEFVIVIRDVRSSDASMTLESVIESGCQSLARKGFINYFGMQRFGTFSISTSDIGKELLLGNWEGAVQMILADQENVLPTSKHARSIWETTKDPKEAIKHMPRQCSAEISILKSLAQYQKNEEGNFDSNSYYQSVMKISRNLRTMYVHAYQSFVWNTVVSKRIEKYGLEVVEGDLVIIENDNSLANSKDNDNEFEDFDEDLRKEQFVHTRALTRSDIESGQYTIHDIVMPTPGFDIQYPADEIQVSFYREVMESDGMDPFDMRRKVRDFSLAGSYRNIMGKPENLEYHLVQYTDPNQQLVNTDLEILNNLRGKENAQKYMKDKLQRLIPNKGGDKNAVILQFQLQTSCYATMALRELMKMETSRRGDMFMPIIRDSDFD